MGGCLESLSLQWKATLVFALSLSLMLINLDRTMIYILDEAKNAECAREMWESGNYIVPKFNDQLRTDKPPLHYFFMSAAYELFGVSAFSARFFSAVFGAATVLITFLFTRRFLSEKKAFIAVLVLISSLHFNFQMRLAVPDPYLIFFMTASFMCFYTYLQSSKRLWLWLMYASIGLGLLTKGPVALGLPGIVMFAFLLITKRFNWTTIKSFYIIPGIVIMLVIALPWYWLNYQATQGAWTEGFFFKHNLQRFSGTMEGHGGFFLLPLIMVIVGLLPLGIFSLQALVENFRKQKHEVVLFSQCAVIGIVLFFSFSQTKLPNYTAPSYPFLAITIAWLMSKLLNRAASFTWAAVALWVYLIISLVLAVVVYLLPTSDPGLQEIDMIWLCFVPMAAGALLSLYLFRGRRISAMLASLGISVIFTNLLFFGYAYPAVYANNPVQKARHIVQPASKVVYYKMMNSAFVFDQQRIIPMISSTDSLKSYFRDNPDALLISRQQFEEEITNSLPGLRRVFGKPDIFEKPVTTIYRLDRSPSP